jgi:molybdopterin molybdotransferase
MPQFLTIRPPFESLEFFLGTIPSQPLSPETIPTGDAIGRILAEDIHAPHPLPEFPRSTVDGYAVIAADTHGASESIPAFLTLVGEVPMGRSPDFEIKPGTAALIHTGGMIPAGADAVVMLEQSQQVHKGEVEIYKAVGINENLILAGEDVKAGDQVIGRGKLLRIAEIGGLMSIGHTSVSVTRKPRVAILSSGDEVVSPGVSPKLGQVRDINTTTMGLVVREAGGEPISYGIVGDSLDSMQQTAQRAFAECDMLLVTAGSSASSRDLTSVVIASLGKPGVLVHGVQVRPGKPTILAVCDGKPVIGLPGNPVSALVIAGLFVKPAVQKLLGQQVRPFHPTIQATLSANIPSVAGREDWVPVSLNGSPDNWIATPIYFKSNLIFNLVRADALAHIPSDQTGLAAGTSIAVEIL